MFKIISLANKTKGCQNIKQLASGLSEITQNSNLWQLKWLNIRFQVEKPQKRASETFGENRPNCAHDNL